tara:strand:+ start:197 stop:454 length:258 start_codon:yes stop_codon:yes gene_type:complete
MCLFKQPKPQAIAPATAPIQPRVATDTTVPTAKQVVKDDEVATVQYGTGQKKAGPAAGKKTGTDALKINMNTGMEAGTKSGGLNV